MIILSTKQLILQKKGTKELAVIVFIDLLKAERSKKFTRFLEIIDTLGITYAIIDSSLFTDSSLLERLYKSLWVTRNTLVITLVDRDTVEDIIIAVNKLDMGLQANIEAFLQDNKLQYRINNQMRGVDRNRIFILGKLLNYVNYFVPFIRWIGFIDRK